MYRLQRSRQRVISVVSSGSFYKCCCLYTVISVVFPSAHWFMWKTNLQLVKTWSFHSDGGRLVALPSNRAVPNSFHLCFWFFFFFNQQIFVTVSVPSTVCYREIKTCQGCCSQSAYRQVYFSTQSCYNLSRDTRITALPAQQRPGSSYLTPQLILPGFPCFYGTLGMSWGCY